MCAKFEGKIADCNTLEHVEAKFKSDLARILNINMDEIFILHSGPGSFIVYFWLPTSLAWQLQNLSEHQQDRMEELFHGTLDLMEATHPITLTFSCALREKDLLLLITKDGGGAQSESLCLHLCMCLFVCMCACVCAHIHGFVDLWVGSFMFLHVFVCVHLCVNVCLFACMCVCMSLSVHVYMYMCTCICV